MKTNNVTMMLAMLCLLSACSPEKPAPSPSETKAVLLEQLRTTHSKKKWFVPIHTALEGVTAEQAMWRDSSGNHSIGQLAYHLLFWNKRQLAKFSGQPEGEWPSSNEETFDAFTKEGWQQTVAQLDSVMTAMEQRVEQANEEQLKQWSETIANISAHNAYHTGQIVVVRKLQRVWDPEKGVK